jgi:biotin-(acetyl-CoA carboxylase) ligase
MQLPDPAFPPLLTGHPVEPPLAPLAEACRRLETQELGAADVVWSRDPTRAAMAIVLEPDVALERAVQMAPLMMVALGDCIGSLCPPKVAVHYRWPATILLNGSAAGEVRIAAASTADERPPPWLVVGVSLAIAADEDRRDWSSTSLAEEAGPDITRTDVLQSLAAHFLAWLNIWQEDGFRPVHDRWLFRAEGREEPASVVNGAETIKGQVLGLDEGANLLIKPSAGGVRTLRFADHVSLEGMRQSAS